MLVPCLVKLRTEFDQLSPRRDRGADGSIGDANHTSTSDHTPDEDSDKLRNRDSDHRNEVHALDIDSTGPWPVPFAEVMRGIIARERARWLDPDDVCRLEYVIWDRQIYSRSRDFRPVAYTGDDPHTGHAHFSARYLTEAENDVSSWGVLETGGSMALIFRDMDEFRAAIADANTAWANSAEGKRAICQATFNTDDVIPSPKGTDLQTNPYTKGKSYLKGTHEQVLDANATLGQLSGDVATILDRLGPADPPPAS